MVTGRASVSSTDRFASLQKRIAELARKDVLVGITEEKSTREHSGEINNAELLYAHSHGIRKKAMREEMKRNIAGGMKYSAAHSLYIREHGSPLFDVPPRPVLEPAIEDKKEQIALHLKNASSAALSGDAAELKAELNAAGQTGASAAQKWFKNPKNGWPENAKQTIRRKGSDQPLIDTGQMRKAIAYILRDKDA